MDSLNQATLEVQIARLRIVEPEEEQVVEPILVEVCLALFVDSLPIVSLR